MREVIRGTALSNTGLSVHHIRRRRHRDTTFDAVRTWHFQYTKPTSALFPCDRDRLRVWGILCAVWMGSSQPTRMVEDGDNSCVGFGSFQFPVRDSAGNLRSLGDVHIQKSGRIPSLYGRDARTTIPQSVGRLNDLAARSQLCSHSRSWFFIAEYGYISPVALGSDGALGVF